MKKIFKKGEYIVYIGDTDNSYRKNHVYKQREDFSYLRSELDSLGSISNGWSIIEPKANNWRYATIDEANEYERIGKPYDVTTLSIIKVDKIQESEQLAILLKQLSTI